jgi:hypothetical protein
LPQARHPQQRHFLQRSATKYGGLEVSDARRLKVLEDEQHAEAAGGSDARQHMLKDIASKKW